MDRSSLVDLEEDGFHTSTSLLNIPVHFNLRPFIHNGKVAINLS